MIDLHIHTSYSDGADSLIEILKKSEKKGLKYISITDHDNCKAYGELANLKIEDYYNGKIVSGIEIKCGYKKRLIEVLGYNINTEKMQKWADEYYKDKTRSKLQQKYFDILYKRCKEMGVQLSEEARETFDSSKEWASVHIYKELIKYEENKKLFPEGILDTFNNFSKKYCGDIKSKLYIDKTTDYPSLQEAIDIIKKCNGLVFLPHLFIYKWAEDKEKFIDEILENYEIDGIECMHSEFTEEQIKYLINLSEKRNYFKSGGSDYHGANKIGIELGKGKGNLHIPEEFVEEWINFTKNIDN